MTATLQKTLPVEVTELTAEQQALSALRAEIDNIDDQILELFERRLAIAAQVGKAKDAPSGPHTKLRPDREQAVLERLKSKAQPQNQEAVGALWREIVGWGLARQGRLQVQVYAPVEGARAMDAARTRFGAAADIRIVYSAETALAHAAEGHGVSVLAINGDEPWWIGLRKEWSMLSVFEGLGSGDTPTALAVGRIDPPALPAGRRVTVSAGGESGDGSSARRWGLNTHHGWSLALTDADLSVGDAEGCVGAII